MTDLVIEYGGLGLLIVSFLAATLLPFSSEVALFTAVSVGLPATEALIWASVGNVSACIFNYGLGYFFREKADASIQKSSWGRRAMQLWQKYGVWALLLNWAPLIGDPITIAAGLGRFNFWIFLILVVLLRVGRYMLVLSLV
ncbi:MAG: DedA family protein [Bacteroidetes bacterium]|nr:DedA family protein [Bacteroidota bacterium]MCH8524392.1 VTT domain-containing protein [Balneolales bacterium]